MADSLLNAASTAAVIMGASDWRAAALAAAPSFRRSAKAVLRLLVGQNFPGLGLDPELVLDFFDDPAPAAEQLAELRDRLDELLRDRQSQGQPVVDLFFYYVGHGITDAQAHLTLLVRGSRKGMEAETSIRVPDLARVLRVSAPKQRRLVVLDCCFSEAAARSFIGMGGSLAATVAAGAGRDIGKELPGRGGLLLCSSPAAELSIGPPESQFTLFTGAFLEVLEKGVEGAGPQLSFAEMTDDRMVGEFGRDAPRPALHAFNQVQGDLSRVPAFRNGAVDEVTFRRIMADAFEMAGHHEALYRLLTEGVSRNEVWAKVRLGHLHRNGHCGFQQDHATAARWYRAAADQGDPSAQAFYAMYLADGLGGVAKDDEAALRYLRLSAEQNNADGLFGLGKFYQEGRAGLTSSMTEAARLWQRSADAGCAPSMAYLAICYAKGTGVGKDLGRTKQLLQKAGELGFKQATQWLAAIEKGLI
jgi:Caspase domain/Sel1 repeat